MAECPMCKGRKRVFPWVGTDQLVYYDQDYTPMDKECPTCKGTGVVNDDE